MSVAPLGHFEPDVRALPTHNVATLASMLHRDLAARRDIHKTFDDAFPRLGQLVFSYPIASL